MKRTLLMVGVVTVLAGGCATSPSLQKPETAIPKAEIQPVDPMKTLMSMARKIAAMDRLGVSIRMGYDVLQPSGQKIAFGERRDILLDRPDRLRDDIERSDGDRIEMVFDGRTMTLYHAGEKIYASIERPGNLDGLVHYAVDDLGIRVPLGWMLLSTLPEDLKKLTVESAYVERDMLDDPATDHIAGRTEEVDYQFWIGPDHLPRRLLLTYREEPGQPQFWAEFSDWNLNPGVSVNSFTFTPPAGAEQVPFVIPKRDARTGKIEPSPSLNKRAK